MQPLLQYSGITTERAAGCGDTHPTRRGSFPVIIPHRPCRQPNPHLLSGLRAHNLMFGNIVRDHHSGSYDGVLADPRIQHCWAPQPIQTSSPMAMLAMPLSYCIINKSMRSWRCMSVLKHTPQESIRSLYHDSDVLGSDPHSAIDIRACPTCTLSGKCTSTFVATQPLPPFSSKTSLDKASYAADIFPHT